MIIGTCGHELTEYGGITIKDYFNGERCTVYCCVCPECKKLYEEDGIILNNETEEQEWMNG